MHFRTFLLNIIAFFVVILMTSHSYALENIIYNQNISRSSEILIRGFFTQNNQEFSNSYKTAPVDLNGDGFEEFFVMDLECKQKHSFCSFHILAETDNNITSIGQIEAANIALADTSTSGVRDLLVYNNPLNDFDYSLYVWAAERSRYILLEGENKDF